MASTATILKEQPNKATPVGVLELPVSDDVPGVNRRTLPRITGRFAVEAPDEGAVFEGLDLSFGCLMCTGGAPVWPGNQMPLRLRLGQTTVDVVGRVVDLVTCKGRIAMRVRFDDVAASGRKAIARWMAAEAERRERLPR